MKTILVKPVITEKSMYAATRGAFTFEVGRATSKSQIASAVESGFGVHVTAVRTVNRRLPGKRVGRLRTVKAVAPIKLAIVTLKKGEKIALFDLKEK